MAKRTYEQSVSFFKTRKTEHRGMGRELYETKISDIYKIIKSLLSLYPELKDKTWIDPCAGDGRWMKVARELGVKKTQSYDITPLSEEVSEQDFFIMDEIVENSFIIGNPPFSKVSDFINRALELADICYFLGGSAKLTGNLSSKCKMLHRFEGYEGNQRDRRSKMIFEATNDENVLVWACGGLFTGEEYEPFARVKENKENHFRVGVYSFCQEDDRIKTIRK